MANREQAIKWIYDGEKVTHEEWFEECYLFNDNEGLQCENGVVNLREENGWKIWKDEEDKKEVVGKHVLSELELKALAHLVVDAILKSRITY